MFGVMLNETSDVICDNQVVVNNIILSRSTLGKKHNSVKYQVLRDTYEARILRLGKEDTETNLSGLLKNILINEGSLGCDVGYG